MSRQIATLSKGDEQLVVDLLELLNVEGLQNDVKEKWVKICLFDFSREKLLLTSKDRSFGYEDQYVYEMEQEYRKFLFIRSIHPNEKLPMSKEVDDFWHAHVLNTHSYQKFIDECADGKFIHHRPTVSDEENM
jgi:hypothetical protein